jgi:SAM-dependent methyltransferase
MNDSWQSGIAYDRYMGRWSRPLGRKFLDWFAAGPGLSWLDVGCGTGSLTRLILETQRPKEIIAIDSSEEFLAHARASITDSSVHFKLGLAQSPELDSGSMDAIVSGLVLNFVPQPEAAMLEWRRITKSGGGIGAFVWDYADGMQMLRYFWDAALALDPKAAELDEAVRFPICREGQLEALVRGAGLRQVEAAPVVIETAFKDFDDYWKPFLGGAGPASAYAMSLNEADRGKFEARLRQALPIAGDGSITLSARAWAAKGMV